MQKLVYILFLVVLLPDFLDRYNMAPHAVKWVPELFSGIILLIVILRVVQTRAVYIGPWYWLVFAMILVHLLFGVIVNGVSSGAIFNGIRIYFKFFPLFFLPAVYQFSEEDLKKQLFFLGGLVLLQLPVSIYQRFLEGAGIKSGDVVTGTLTTGGHESIFLFCAISVLIAFYLKRYIGKTGFFILFMMCLLPTTLNETKASIFLLPVALILPVLAMKGGLEKIRALAVFGVAGAAFLAVFFAAYQHFYVPEDSRRFDDAADALDFFSEDGRFKAYLSPSTSYDSERVGKLDKVLIPIMKLSDDPVQLMFGLGIGNMTRSTFGTGFGGEYYEENVAFVGATLPTLLWETGVLGAIFSLVLLGTIFKDAILVSRHRDDYTGTLALGMVGVLGIIVLSLMYRNIINPNGIGQLVTYFAGCIAASRSRMDRGQAQPLQWSDEKLKSA